MLLVLLLVIPNEEVANVVNILDETFGEVVLICQVSVDQFGDPTYLVLMTCDHHLHLIHLLNL